MVAIVATQTIIPLMTSNNVPCDKSVISVTLLAIRLSVRFAWVILLDTRRIDSDTDHIQTNFPQIVRKFSTIIDKLLKVL